MTVLGGNMFVLTRAHQRRWDPDDKVDSYVATWFDARGNRFFLVRMANGGKYDFRVLVEGEVRANRRSISVKAVVIAARTLGILLTSEQIEVLTRSTVAR